MTPEKLFHDLLGLGLNWMVTECEFDRESGVMRLRIEETEHLWRVERSPGDGAEVACYDHTEEMVWRHLNVFEHKCEIRCRLPRARCSKPQKRSIEASSAAMARDTSAGVAKRQAANRSSNKRTALSTGIFSSEILEVTKSSCSGW